MDQKSLWAQVNTIKLRVLSIVGPDLSALSHEFRSTQAFQTYTALCGEAQMAYEDGSLDAALVKMVEEYADKVIDLWGSGMR